MPTVGSLCAGFGGLERGIRPVTGGDVVWHAETDPAASTVLAHHHPDVPNLGDITSVRWKGRAVDILAAGWPCQPFSAAGKQLGSADARHLWPFVRAAVAGLLPSMFVGENVPRLLTIENGAVFGTVLTDLDALGYTVRWSTVGACRVGACHHRHRVFIVAVFDPALPPGEPFAYLGGPGWRPCAGGLFGDDGPVRWPAAGTVHAGYAWAGPSVTCGLVDSMLPTPTVRDSTRGAGWGDQPGSPLSEVIALLPTPRATDGTNGTNQRGSSGDLMLPSAVLSEQWGKYAAAIAQHESAFGQEAPAPTITGARGGRKLSPWFVEWMQGLPAGYVAGVPGIKVNDALRILGNGVVGQAAAYALTRLLAATTTGRHL